MSAELVELTIDDRVATVTFSRPERDNLVSHEMLEQCDARLAAARNSDAQVLVIRGEGDHFSLGRDQDEDLGDVTREELIKLIMSANESVAEFDGVAISLVQGKAFGFACGIAVQCDLTVAGDTAEFGFNEIEHGFAPKIVLSYLETYVNRKAAIDLVMTGRNVPAHEAKALGLVSRVVTADHLDAYGEGLVDHFLGLDGEAVAAVKFFLRDVETVPPEDVNSFVLQEML